MASKIANELLKENQKLRGVHSKESIKKILQQEVLRQMQNRGEYIQPTISRINEKQDTNSNLAHLHKNLAV